ncbi:hypothetical protein E3N88_32224 [Mikania micrantha]|uniref:Uncharacterized protein n=1 Tax=Mikania micrantha TaxID=192012 RepID=A0A5N6M7U2_9ASTR|nr:hypothetical protein E3N88_32224 [Mikania micrantha]
MDNNNNNKQATIEEALVGKRLAPSPTATDDRRCSLLLAGRHRLSSFKGKKSRKVENMNTVIRHSPRVNEIWGLELSRFRSIPVVAGGDGGVDCGGNPKVRKKKRMK